MTRNSAGGNRKTVKQRDDDFLTANAIPSPLRACHDLAIPCYPLRRRMASPGDLQTFLLEPLNDLDLDSSLSKQSYTLALHEIGRLLDSEIDFADSSLNNAIRAGDIAGEPHGARFERGEELSPSQEIRCGAGVGENEFVDCVRFGVSVARELSGVARREERRRRSPRDDDAADTEGRGQGNALPPFLQRESQPARFVHCGTTISAMRCVASIE